MEGPKCIRLREMMKFNVYYHQNGGKKVYGMVRHAWAKTRRQQANTGKQIHRASGHGTVQWSVGSQADVDAEVEQET